MALGGKPPIANLCKNTGVMEAKKLRMQVSKTCPEPQIGTIWTAEIY